MENLRERLALGERYAPVAYAGYRLAPGEGVDPSGFRTPAWSAPKPAGVWRVACFGEGLLEGADLAPEHRFRAQLEGRLAAARDGPVEVACFALAGWSSAESLVTFLLHAQDFEPDVVLALHGPGDLWPRLRADFAADYSSHREPFGLRRPGAWSRFWIEHSAVVASLWLLGEPGLGVGAPTERPWSPEREDFAPESLAPFVRNLETLAGAARSMGAQVALMTHPVAPDEEPPRGISDALWRRGLGEHNGAVRALAEELDLGLVDLAEPGLFGAEDFEGALAFSAAGSERAAREVARGLGVEGESGR